MGEILVAGGIGVAGAVLGSVVTYWLAQRGERARVAVEDARRWLTDRRSLYASYLKICESMLREIDNIGVLLSYDGSEAISAEDDATIRNCLAEYFGRWDDELQLELAELQLLATPKVVDLADRMSGALMDITSDIEARHAFVQYYPTWFQARDLLEVLRNAMRTELGLDKTATGPIRDPNWPWLADRPSRESYVQHHPSQAPRQ